MTTITQPSATHVHTPDYTRSVCACHGEQEVYCRGCGADLTKGHEGCRRPGSTATVKPSAEALTETIGRRLWAQWDRDPRDEDAFAQAIRDAAQIAEDILALLPGRTEAEVRAEALREAAHVVRSCKRPGHWNLSDPDDPDAAYSPDVFLEVLANRIEKGR